MENKILNKKALKVFVIIAESLEAWKNMSTDFGKEVLQKHYSWLTELKNNRILILSGPTDFEFFHSNEFNSIGHTTGLIMLNVKSREDAEEWALKDPFHTNGFRNNRVYSMKITATSDLLINVMEKEIDIE